MKLSSVIEGYWLDRRRTFSRHTVTRYSRVFAYLTTFVGDIDFHTITSRDIKRFLDHLEDTRGYSRRSLNDSLMPLSSLWTWAETELGTPHIIRGKISAIAYPKPIIEPFTQDEIKALLAGADYGKPWSTRSGKQVRSKRRTADRDRAIILTLLDTGIRAQELCDLTVADYDQKRGRLHIRHGKGDKARTVYLGDRAKKALWRLLGGREIKSTAPLFAAKSGEHLSRDNMRHALQRIAGPAGVENVYPHRFRHTFAIEFLRNGGSELVLQALLGHEDIKTVQIYVRLAELDIERSRQHSPGDNWKL